MNRPRKVEIHPIASRMRSLLRTITVSLWGVVVLGIVYYFLVIHDAQELPDVHTNPLTQTEWLDVPLAEVGAGVDYERLNTYGAVYALDYDTIWGYTHLERRMSLMPAEDDIQVEQDTMTVAIQQSLSRVTFAQTERRPGSLSDWDYLFQRYGDTYGWDWTVLASIAYQESHFQPEIVGIGGATGLMGVMPATGRRYGYSRQQLKVAEISIRIACMALRDFGRAFAHITDREQRMKFTLASYNVGSAHVLDARRLAERDGLDPDLWDDAVALYMARLEEPKYYKDPLVRHGSARGRHTVRYVEEVFARAQFYKMNALYATTE